MTRHPRRRRIEGGGLVFSVLEEASSWTIVAVSDDDAGAAIGRCSVLDDAGSCCLPVLSLMMFEYLLHMYCTMMSARANMQTAQDKRRRSSAVSFSTASTASAAQPDRHLRRFVSSAKPSQAAQYLPDTPFATQSLPQPPVHPMSIASACRHEAGR